MKRSERIEAAAKEISPNEFDEAMSHAPGTCETCDDNRRYAHETATKALDAAYPELASGTHVLLPREPGILGDMLADWANWPPEEGEKIYKMLLSAYERSKPESE